MVWWREWWRADGDGNDNDDGNGDNNKDDGNDPKLIAPGTFRKAPRNGRLLTDMPKWKSHLLTVWLSTLANERYRSERRLSNQIFWILFDQDWFFFSLFVPKSDFIGLVKRSLRRNLDFSFQTRVSSYLSIPWWWQMSFYKSIYNNAECTLYLLSSNRTSYFFVNPEVGTFSIKSKQPSKIVSIRWKIIQMGHSRLSNLIAYFNCNRYRHQSTTTVPCQVMNMQQLRLIFTTWRGNDLIL